MIVSLVWAQCFFTYNVLYQNTDFFIENCRCQVENQYVLHHKAEPIFERPEVSPTAEVSEPMIIITWASILEAHSSPRLPQRMPGPERRKQASRSQIKLLTRFFHLCVTCAWGCACSQMHSISECLTFQFHASLASKEGGRQGCLWALHQVVMWVCLAETQGSLTKQTTVFLAVLFERLPTSNPKWIMTLAFVCGFEAWA